MRKYNVTYDVTTTCYGCVVADSEKQAELIMKLEFAKNPKKVSNVTVGVLDPEAKNVHVF